MVTGKFTFAPPGSRSKITLLYCLRLRGWPWSCAPVRSCTTMSLEGGVVGNVPAVPGAVINTMRLPGNVPPSVNSVYWLGAPDVVPKYTLHAVVPVGANGIVT